jgi:hypothetical protein
MNEALRLGPLLSGETTALHRAEGYRVTTYNWPRVNLMQRAMKPGPQRARTCCRPGRRRGPA